MKCLSNLGIFQKLIILFVCFFLPCIRYIDRGRNPQLYTKDCIEKALHKNEQVKGKIDSLKKFKANVLSDLGQTFPNELAKYRALRSNCYGTSSVVAPPPPPPPLSMSSSLGGPNLQQQQNLMGGSSLSIQQQQLNNAPSLVGGSCLNNLQQPIATISLLGCDGISTSSTGNSIGGPSGI